MKMVETVIDESKLFYASNLFGEKDVAPPPGTILSQSASSILDLYQAIYPIKHAKALEEPKNGLLFSNSCLYMAGAIQRIEDTLYGQSNVKERLAECRHNLLVSGDSWFDETIVSVFTICVMLLRTQ
jgi:centromere/kinetochore protein ZW10